MSTDYGKDRILKPGGGHKAIIKVSWTSTQFGNKVLERVGEYFEKHLKSDDVRKKFTEIKEKIATFYKHVCQEVSYMENDWTNVQNDGDKRAVFVSNDDDEISPGSVVDKSVVLVSSRRSYYYDDIFRCYRSVVVEVVVATSPLWVPLLIAGVGLAVALSPVLVPLSVILGRESRKKKIIDEEYEKWKMTIRGTIYNHLDENNGAVLRRFIIR